MLCAQRYNYAVVAIIKKSGLIQLNGLRREINIYLYRLKNAIERQLIFFALIKNIHIGTVNTAPLEYIVFSQIFCLTLRAD